MTMKTLTTSLLALFWLATTPIAAQAKCAAALLDHDIRKLRSTESVNLCEAYSNRPLLVINTASRCGYTPQFKGLEALHQRYKDRGLAIAGFPSNSFRQEESNEVDIARVCYVNYGVTFTMFEDVAVKGNDAHPLFKQLAAAAGAPRWNFNKYLIGADGKVIKRWDSSTRPDDPALIDAIEAALLAR